MVAPVLPMLTDSSTRSTRCSARSPRRVRPGPRCSRCTCGPAPASGSRPGWPASTRRWSSRTPGSTGGVLRRPGLPPRPGERVAPLLRRHGLDGQVMPPSVAPDGGGRPDGRRPPPVPSRCTAPLPARPYRRRRRRRRPRRVAGRRWTGGVVRPAEPARGETWWPVTRVARIASNRDAHARRRHPAGRARRTDRDPRRVGGPPPRPRRGRLHRPARPLGVGPGGVPRGRDGRGSHRLRAEFCVQVVGEVVARPAGNENPELPTGAIEITATALTVLSESAPLPFPVDEYSEVGEEVRLATATWTCAAPGRPPRCGCAARPTGSPARSCTSATSSRSRRPRSPAPRPRAPATSWCPRGCSPAPGTRCRRARSCSSSC